MKDELKPFIIHIQKNILLSKKEILLLTTKIKVRNSLKGQYILQQGDPCKYLNFVISGTTKTYNIDNKHKSKSFQVVALILFPIISSYKEYHSPSLVISSLFYTFASLRYKTDNSVLKILKFSVIPILSFSGEVIRSRLKTLIIFRQSSLCLSRVLNSIVSRRVRVIDVYLIG